VCIVLGSDLPTTLTGLEKVDMSLSGSFCLSDYAKGGFKDGVGLWEDFELH
jgi:hypothetical protein